MKIKTISNATTIAIIGVAGKKELSMAALFAEKYHVLLFDHDQDKLSKACLQITIPGKFYNAEVMQCPTDASWQADIIILTGAGAADHSLSKKIERVATQKIVIVFATDTSSTPFTASEFTWQQLLPHTKVIIVQDAGSGTESELSKQLIMECNDEDALKTGEAFFTSVGFHIQTLFTAFNQ